jgi:hypothetical protein
VVRVEVAGKKIIGVKFPTEKLPDLEMELASVRAAREAKGVTGCFEEPLQPVNPRLLAKATTAPKTMKSFFGMAGGGNDENKGKGLFASNTAAKKSIFSSTKVGGAGAKKRPAAKAVKGGSKGKGRGGKQPKLQLK